jgi:branched-chain amino acid transport system substrate-binding protein
MTVSGVLISVSRNKEDTMFLSKKLRSALGVVCSIVLAGPAIAADPVKVGVVVALTGPGGDIRNGAALAADMVNAEGGLKNLGSAPLEVVFGDSHSTPSSAGSEGERLIDQSGIAVLAGASSSAETIPLSVAAERKGVPMIVINGQSEEITNRGFKWLWSLGVQDKDFMSTAIAALRIAQKQVPELKRVAMVYGDNETGQAAGRAFRELMKVEKTFEIIGDVEYSARAQDFGPTVLKIKSTGAQMIVLNGAFREVVGFARAFDQYDFHPMQVTLGGGTADPKFGAQVGKSANGVFNSTSFAIDLQKVQKVAAAYLEKYKSPMSTNAAQGYQTVRTIAEVLDLAGSKSPDAIAAAIRKIKTPAERIATSSAFIEFEGSLNKGRRALLTQWQNGKLVTVWPDDVAVGSAIAPPVNTK